MHENQTPAAEKKTRKKYRMAAPLGFTVICFALIGVICLVTLGVLGIRKLQDDSGQKEAILRDISLVIGLDPVPFDRVEDAGDSFLLTASLWQATNNHKLTSPEGYPINDSGQLIIPQSDVEVAFRELFGPGHKVPAPKSNTEGQIYFDEGLNSYIMPSTAFVSYIHPVIDEKTRIHQKNGTYTVLIGYQNSETVPGENTSEQADAVYKTMRYRLGRSDSGRYYVLSIQETGETESQA